MKIDQPATVQIPVFVLMWFFFIVAGAPHFRQIETGSGQVAIRPPLRTKIPRSRSLRTWCAWKKRPFMAI
jgi:hypothetical protein